MAANMEARAPDDARLAELEEEVFADWRRGIARVAARENVHVEFGAPPPVSEEVAAGWRPWIETCFEAFGPARSMFDSNFPARKRWCRHQVRWNAFKRLAAAASADEKRDVFAGAAAAAHGMNFDAGREAGDTSVSSPGVRTTPESPRDIRQCRRSPFDPFFPSTPLVEHEIHPR